MPKTLREWRAEKLLSVRDLAAQAAVSTKTISQIEHGRGVPTFGTMRKISTALGVEPIEIREFRIAIIKRSK